MICSSTIAIQSSSACGTAAVPCGSLAEPPGCRPSGARDAPAVIAASPPLLAALKTSWRRRAWGRLATAWVSLLPPGRPPWRLCCGCRAGLLRRCPCAVSVPSVRGWVLAAGVLSSTFLRSRHSDTPARPCRRFNTYSAIIICA